MADKKKDPSSILIKIFGFGMAALLVSFFLAAVVASEVEYSTVFALEAFSSSIFMTVLPVSLAVCILVAILLFTGSKSSDSKEMKGKDDLENQHFLEKSKYDKELPNYYFDELYKVNIEGWPIHTQLIGKRMKVYFGPKYHMLIIGATGSGKTETFVHPAIQILSESKTKPSFFITDTKGEIYATHSKKLEADGYDIKVVDLTDPYRSTQWNPLE